MVWEKPWKQREQQERSLPGRKVRAVSEEGRLWELEGDGESQAREAQLWARTELMEQSCWTLRACPVPALLATAHATSHLLSRVDDKVL